MKKAYDIERGGQFEAVGEERYSAQNKQAETSARESHNQTTHVAEKSFQYFIFNRFVNFHTKSLINRLHIRSLMLVSQTRCIMLNVHCIA